LGDYWEHPEFAALVDAHGAALLALLRRLCRHEQDAEDAVERPLRLFNVPLDRLEQVQGDVTIIATLEYANSGTRHADGLRFSYIEPPRECTISGIDGALSAWFARSTLKLDGVRGQIDVNNEAGDTTLTVAGQLPEVAHRVVSQSGRIEVHASPDALGALPVTALTNQGSVRTNAEQQTLDGTNFTTGNPSDGSGRNWRGFKTKRDFNPATFMDEARRPAAVLANEPRSAGFDLISRSGAVVLFIGQ
jgi:hypothetical protein